MNIQYLYDNVEKAKRMLSEANKLGGTQRKRDAMREWNKHWNALRIAQRGGKRTTYHPDFETRVAGIPCGVVIENNPEELLYFLVDRLGYPAQWLEKKLTKADHDKIEALYLAHIKEI